MENISLNFGAIKDTVYRVSAKEMLNESNFDSKNNSLNKFIKKIKEEPMLKIQYMIFENLTKGHFSKERLAERYINENLSLANKLNWNKLLECNKKVRQDILSENFVNGDENFEKLYESIHTLIESKSNLGFTKINEAHESYENVLNHLQREVSKVTKEKEEKEDMPKFLSWRYINEHAVNNFNKRYNHLNESDKKLFKILVSSEDIKLKYAKELKEESIQKIEDILSNDDTMSDLLNNFKNKIESINEINTNNVDEIIINCSELMDSLEKNI
jgi:chemotaxis protein histidine kinase CheA